jgi:hypothetical protein
MEGMTGTNPLLSPLCQAGAESRLRGGKLGIAGLPLYNPIT